MCTSNKRRPRCACLPRHGACCTPFHGAFFSQRSRLPPRLCARPWVEFFHGQLRPWVHYIPVRADLADLAQATRRAAATVLSAAAPRVDRVWQPLHGAWHVHALAHAHALRMQAHHMHMHMHVHACACAYVHVVVQPRAGLAQGPSLVSPCGSRQPSRAALRPRADVHDV